MNNPTEIFVCGVDASGNKTTILTNADGSLVTTGGGGGGGGTTISDDVVGDITYNLSVLNNDSIIGGARNCTNYNTAILYLDPLPTGASVQIKINGETVRANSRSVDYFEINSKVTDVINQGDFNTSGNANIFDTPIYGDLIDIFASGVPDGTAFSGKLVLTRQKKGEHIDLIELKEQVKFIRDNQLNGLPNTLGARPSSSSFPVVLNSDNPIGNTTDPIASSATGNFSLISLIKFLNNIINSIQSQLNTIDNNIDTVRETTNNFNQDFGQTGDSTASTDTGTFSFMAFFKRLLFVKLPDAIAGKIPVISDINPSSLPGETNEGELINITTKESLRRIQGSFSNVLDTAGEFYQFNFDTTRSICIQYNVVVGASSSIEIQFQFSANTTGTFFTNVSAENTNITYTESTVDSVIIQDLPAGLIRLTVINVTGTAQITSSVYAAHN